MFRHVRYIAWVVVTLLLASCHNWTTIKVQVSGEGGEKIQGARVRLLPADCDECSEQTVDNQFIGERTNNGGDIIFRLPFCDEMVAVVYKTFHHTATIPFDSCSSQDEVVVLPVVLHPQTFADPLPGAADTARAFIEHLAQGRWQEARKLVAQDADIIIDGPQAASAVFDRRDASFDHVWAQPLDSDDGWMFVMTIFFDDGCQRDYLLGLEERNGQYRVISFRLKESP